MIIRMEIPKQMADEKMSLRNVVRLMEWFCEKMNEIIALYSPWMYGGNLEQFMIGRYHMAYFETVRDMEQVYMYMMRILLNETIEMKLTEEISLLEYYMLYQNKGGRLVLGDVMQIYLGLQEKYNKGIDCIKELNSEKTVLMFDKKRMCGENQDMLDSVDALAKDIKMKKKEWEEAYNHIGDEKVNFWQSLIVRFSEECEIVEKKKIGLYTNDGDLIGELAL